MHDADRASAVQSICRTLIAGLLAAASAQSAGNEVAGRGLSIPAELETFLHPGETLIAHVQADLNGDGRKDSLFVVEQSAKQPGSDEEGPRTAKIAVRLPDGSLALRASSGKAVLCRSCGGMMGDPFVDISAGKSKFAIHHYGGGSWRWSADYHFAYSRRDDTWQLVLVREESFHAGSPDKPTVRTYRPPTHFGKIDFTAFDPERFKGQGMK